MGAIDPGLLLRGAGAPSELADLRRGSADDPRTLERACKEFESLFMKELLKSMRKTVPKDGILGESFARDTMTDMLDGELAREMSAAGGIGIHRLLVEQLGAHGEAGAPPALAAPLAGALRVTSPFGQRVHPIDGVLRNHAGLDLAAPHGAPVCAAAAGVVEAAGPRAGYGLAIDVRHRGRTVTRYAHLSEVLVEPGQRLARGQLLGKVGATGRATGPHLHFEVRIGGQARDPAALVKGERESPQEARYAVDVRDEQ